LERYCYAWNIRGGAWRRPFALHPDGYNAPFTRRSKAMLRLLNRWREVAIAPLAEFEKAMGRGGAADISRAVYELLIHLKVPEQLEVISTEMPQDMAQLYRQVWDAATLLLDDMADMADPNVTPERYAELLRLAAAQVKLGAIPATRDQVLVSEVERVVGAGVKCAFVAGFTDGDFPAAPAGSALLTDGERRQLEAADLPLSPVAAAAWPEERYLAYNALTAATERLYITMPRRDLSGGALRSSVFLPHLKALMPFNDIEDAAEILAREGPASSAKAVDLLLAGGGSKNYVDRPEFYRAAALREAVSAAGQKKPIANASKLYAGRGGLSATSGERFAKCNFSYFCQYGLRLKPTKRNEFDAMQTGTFIHYVLERFFAKVPAGERGDLTQGAAAKILDGIIEEYVGDFLPDEGERSARMQYLFSRLSKIVHSYMAILLDELQNSEFVPLDFELEVGRDIPALVYGEGERKITVRGKIDRVDGLKKDGRTYIRIVDYKTGMKELSYPELYQGIGLQMFLYLAAVLAGGRERYGEELCPAGVVYAPVRLDTVSLADRGATDEEVRRARMDKVKKNGLLLDDEEVLRAMDRSGKFLTLPVAADKDGNIRPRGTSTASMERLGALAEFAGRLLDEAAGKIASGSVEVNPLTTRGEQKPDACKFCDMRPVCRYEGAGRGMPYLSEEDFWRAIGGEKVVEDGVYPGAEAGD
ncbi:MAG TPA: PD-(D/E)XK nuclease family protein, partial [Terriglobales bacterium]|nr:PD-(D/E)XK nuclease family protein [Terriglobales bacterium]